MKRLLILAAILILVINAAVFTHVVYNRSGEPQIITLSERELTIPYNYFRYKGENSGLNLRINWRAGYIVSNNYEWAGSRDFSVNEQKLRELGFTPLEGCVNDNHYQVYRGGRDQSRKAWVVIEFNGSAHTDHIKALQKYLDKRIQEIGRVKAEPEQSELERLEDQLQTVRKYQTRLYVIDISLDKQSLVNGYGDNPQNLILAAEISNGSYCRKKQQILEVDIDGLLPARANVPKEFHDVFEGLPRERDSQHLPRYEATIAIGKLNEPWLVDVNRL